jgi:radical SAM-linked protein
VPTAVQNALEEVFALSNENFKYRVKFTKQGNIVFIGHLDLLKLFQRAIKRAGLPIAYSQGFNPHQLEVFAIPLSLGASSVAEYVDMDLTENMPCDEVKSKLANVMPIGIDIVSVRKVENGEKNCAAAIEAADYRLTLDDKFENIDTVISDLLSQSEIIMTRIVKKKEKTVDIRPLIYSLSADNSGEKTVINTRLATGSQGNIKVDLLLEYIYEKLGKELVMYKIRTHRLEMYKREDGEFISL